MPYKKHYSAELHVIPSGYYWAVYPGQQAEIVYISRRDGRTGIGFDYPNATYISESIEPDTREDIAGFCFYGPIEPPTNI